MDKRVHSLVFNYKNVVNNLEKLSYQHRNRSNKVIKIVFIVVISLHTCISLIVP